MKVKYLLIRFVTFLLVPLAGLVNPTALVVMLLVWLLGISPILDHFYIKKLEKQGNKIVGKFTYPYLSFYRFLIFYKG